tara:strand:- start:6379 stop:6696 length:318 start_codon:yes stop_codon:yes gene_type:complete
MNIKKELLKSIDNSKVICAEIIIGSEYDDERVFIRLRLNYSATEFDNFLKTLDCEYNDGYGEQKLYGVVWLDSNKWLERGEYDGSEWWEKREIPAIPATLAYLIQ